VLSHFSIVEIKLEDQRWKSEVGSQKTEDGSPKTATQHHSNTASQQHSNTATQHTVSQHHSNTATQHHSNTALQPSTPAEALNKKQKSMGWV